MSMRAIAVRRGPVGSVGCSSAGTSAREMAQGKIEALTAGVEDDDSTGV